MTRAEALAAALDFAADNGESESAVRATLDAVEPAAPSAILTGTYSGGTFQGTVHGITDALTYAVEGTYEGSGSAGTYAFADGGGDGTYGANTFQGASPGGSAEGYWSQNGEVIVGWIA